MAPPHSALTPARVVGDILDQAALDPHGLIERINRFVTLPGGLAPSVLGVPDIPALDLDDHDTGVGHQCHQIGFQVVGVNGDPHIGQHH